MERAWLERELAAGRSIESLAREVGRPASTVAYWVGKYGLASAHASRHAARGALDRDVLEQLRDRGMSTRAIGRELGRSQASVRHWLGRYGLTGTRVPVSADVREIERACAKHGTTRFVRYSPTDSFRCERCRKERVAARRRRVKEILVEEAGGRCVICGYDRYAGAAVPPHRRGVEELRHRTPRRGPVARAQPGRGGEMRPALRQLSLRGRSRDR